MSDEKAKRKDRLDPRPGEGFADERGGLLARVRLAHRRGPVRDGDGTLKRDPAGERDEREREAVAPQVEHEESAPRHAVHS